MRVVIQRVTSASVTVENRVVGEIGRGFLLLTGIGESDGPAEIDLMAGKIANMRVFEDAEGKMNRSAIELNAEAPASASMLVVSQFTLYADARKGRRPSFVGAARPEHAVPLLERFVAGLEAFAIPVQQGVFGADMAVALVNDGPVTIWLDTDDLRAPRRT
jgi:D-tyrosyl-tRNA(Tyr) deacylase